jgi:hypothetical protein
MKRGSFLFRHALGISQTHPNTNDESQDHPNPNNNTPNTSTNSDIFPLPPNPLPFDLNSNNYGRFFEVLFDFCPELDANNYPDTGLPNNIEFHLSSIFVPPFSYDISGSSSSDETLMYGTRCCTYMHVEMDGKVEIIEMSRNKSGEWEQTMASTEMKKKTEILLSK